jgi:hypothetical protein
MPGPGGQHFEAQLGHVVIERVVAKNQQAEPGGGIGPLDGGEHKRVVDDHANHAAASGQAGPHQRVEAAEER